MTKVEYIAVSHSFLQLLTGMTGQMYCLEYFLTILDPLSATICSLQGRFPKKTSHVENSSYYNAKASLVTENVHCGLLTSARYIIIRPAGVRGARQPQRPDQPVGYDPAGLQAAIGQCSMRHSHALKAACTAIFKATHFFV